MANVKHSGFYTNVLANWHKALGPKPTEAQLSLAHVFGKPGKQAMGIAMALRDGGMSPQAMTGASALFDGRPTPCRNKLVGSTGLVAAGLFERLKPEAGQPTGTIALKITTEGEKWVQVHSGKVTAAKLAVVADKPAKAVNAKAAKKAARKAAVKAATVTVVEPVDEPVDEPVIDLPMPETAISGQPSATE